MSVITKATPRAILRGIQDLSRRPLVVEAEQIPQHLPHVFLFTERGPQEPQLVIGDAFSRTYGSASLDFQSKFATHQTVLAQVLSANGNSMMVQRLKPSGATTAMLRLSVEVVRTKLDKYQRWPDGTFKVDATTGLRLVDTADNYEGFRLVWRRSNIWTGGQKAFGAAQPKANYRTASATAGLSTYDGSGALDDATSTVFPILDLEVSSFGSYGNRVGIRLFAPNADGVSPGDAGKMAAIKSYLYRMACVEKPENLTTPNITTNNGGDLFMDLAFKREVADPQTGLNLSFDPTFIESYQELDVVDQPVKYGPFGRAFMYHDNLQTVLELLRDGTDTGSAWYVGNTNSSTFGGVTVAATGEKQWDTPAVGYGRTAPLAFALANNRHLLNVLTGIDPNGVPYETIDVSKTVTLGGVAFTENTTHYADGGKDGLVDDIDQKEERLANLQIFDSLVYDECANYGDKPYSTALDSAKYPQSAIWDTGFSLETKKKLLVPMSRRKDMYVVLATQAVAEYEVPGMPYDNDPNSVDYNPFNWQGQNNTTDENAFAVALRTAASLYPESEIYGTSVCRATIIGHSGDLLNSPWKHYKLPLTIDFADKVSKYMGAGIGRWTNGQAYDEAPRNQVSMFKNVNNTYKSDSNYNKDWDAGLVWVQYFDRRNLFYPAFQTAYPDDTSVLNAFTTMAACVELEKVAQRSWRELTGNSTLTPEQFIERSNQLIIDNTKDRFDGRFVIVPETFFTEADTQRGYSWSCNIHIYANNMRTVGSFTIVAHRLEDLNQG